jgi:hypothetical protein
MKETYNAAFESIIEEIQNEDHLRDFFQKYDIVNVDRILDCSRYQLTSYRGGLILDVKETGAEKSIRISIDLKLDQPSVNQVYEALYGTGKDCDIRIILYSHGHNEGDINDPTADESVVYSLVNRLQEDNVPIFLSEVKWIGSELIFDHLHQLWEEVHRLKPNKTLTKEQFTAETFWTVYFDSFNEGFYEPWEAYDGGFRNIDDWGHCIYIDCAVCGAIELYWDQGGVRYVIRQDDDSDGILQKAIDLDMPYLQERYGAEAIENIEISGRMPRLKIRYSDRPFDWLYNAESEEIMEFAKAMHEDAWDLRWRIEEFIGDRCEAQTA